MNINSTSHAGERLSSENTSATQNMTDKNIYLDMMNELIESTIENRITIDLQKDNRNSRRNKTSKSAKVTTLQSFFNRAEHASRLHYNSIDSDDLSDKMNEVDDDHDEFYEDDQDTVSSMKHNFKNLSPPFTSAGADGYVGNTSDIDMNTCDSTYLYQSPAKRYLSSLAKPKYNRSQMDSKQVDMLSTSLHTSDGTEVTATETDYSLSGSSHHSHATAMSRSPYYPRQYYSSVKEVEFPRPVAVYQRSINDEMMESSDITALQKHYLLGEGYFGKVYLVSGASAESENFLALKMISKYHLLCEDQVHTVMREKEILQLCCHPNIVTLHATKQDISSLYLLQSYIPGGDLFNMMHHFSHSNATETMGTNYEHHPVFSDESKVQFYVACIADALWYLHCGLSNSKDSINRSVVYRDLKQENVMINERGYPILIDFGYAKILETSLQIDSDGNGSGNNATMTRTYTMCGTAKYVSPEIIEGIGHTCSTDYWSLGVVVYELLTCGREHPFAFTPNIDDLSLYRSIIEADYIPLPDEISADGVDFVDQLLTKDLTLRLGATESGMFNPILQHPWLQRWDVSSLREQSYHAPWIPTPQNPLDPTVTTFQTQSFDTGTTIHSNEEEHLLTFDMDQQKDPNLSMKEQALFAKF